MTCGREIDDAKPSMTESDERRYIGAFIVRPAIGKGLAHLPDKVFSYPLTVKIQFSADATHDIFDLKSFRFVDYKNRIGGQMFSVVHESIIGLLIWGRSLVRILNLHRRFPFKGL